MTDTNFSWSLTCLLQICIAEVTTKIQYNQNTPPQIQTIDKIFPRSVKYATYLKEVNGLNKSF